MLCCVSRRAVAGTDQLHLHNHCPSEMQPVELEKIARVEQYPEPDVPPILLPCAFCARTFMPQSLEKHIRVCEKSTTKKRKPFDSSKQRIQGTELADFLPKQTKRRHAQDDKACNSSWKQTHDEFLRAIRAARCEVEDTTARKQSSPKAPASAPTRANEQGLCPTCNRHFGIKAYDRHVAWCKERVARVTLSPAANIAKERLEARMRYRVPLLKNRRQMNREKYSPGSAVTLNSANKTSPTQTTAKAKETVSAPNCNKTNSSPIKQKPVIVRRSGKAKDTSSPIGSMPRPIDRTNRPPEDECGLVTFRPAPPLKRTFHLPVPSLKHKKETVDERNNTPGKQKYKRQRLKALNSLVSLTKQEATRYREHSGSSHKTNIVSARSQGTPKLNDVSINAIGVSVTPCSMHKADELTTWKRISQEKDQSRGNLKECPRIESKLSRIDSPKLTKQRLIQKDLKQYSINEEQPEGVKDVVSYEDGPKDEDRATSRSTSPINWPRVTPKLNRTYSFKYDELDDVQIGSHRRGHPVKHSPRVEFCLGDLERLSRLHSLVNVSCFRDVDSRKTQKSNKNNEEGSSHYVIKDENSLNDLLSDQRISPDMETEEILREQSASEHFESARSEILKKKRLTSSGHVQLSQQNYYDYEVAETPQIIDPPENPLAAYNTSELNNSCNINYEKSLDCKDVDFSTRPSKNGNAEEESILLCEQNLQTCLEQSLYAEEFEDSAVTKDDIMIIDKAIHGTEREAIVIVDVENIEEKNEWNSDTKGITKSLREELEFSFAKSEHDDIKMFCDMEANVIQMETEPLLMNDILHPNRSSTPFDDAIDGLNSKCEAKEDSQSPGDEWKMTVDTGTGSELLFRVESNDSDYSVTCDMVQKLDKVHFEEESLESRKCSSNTYRKPLQQPIENSCSVSRGVSPIKQKEEQVNVQTLLRKDAASQTDKCKCCIKYFKGEETRSSLNDLSAFKPLGNDSLENSAEECHTITEEALQAQVRCGYGNTDSNSTESELQKERYDLNLDNTDQNCYKLEKYEAIMEETLQTRATCKSFESNSEQDKLQEGQCRSNFEDMNENSNKLEKREMKKREMIMGESSQMQVSHGETDQSCKLDHDTTDGLGNRSFTNTFINSILEMSDVVTNEVQEIYKNHVSNVFDYDSDDTVDGQVSRDAVKFQPLSGKNDSVQVRDFKSIVLSEPRVKLKNTSTSRSSLKSRRSKALDVDNEILENRNRNKLKERSDSLSAIDATEVTGVKQVEAVEVETIEEFGTRNRSIRFRILPEIKGSRVVVKENYGDAETVNTQTYWEKASKATKNRLINLDPPYQGASRFLKRHPNIRVLPPVPSTSSLIQPRNLILPLRPVWSNYVRRRPDFNLVLSGRTGKDYDPFLLAEQQMNELLSDVSEQSATDSPPIEQNRETFFPLSHSSAFVKYPYQQQSLSNPEKRSSVIAPPTEFDDLVSDFSSDSTETNSLSREVFLNDSKQESKAPGTKPDGEKRSPARELGRRVIIDKSKALGGDVVDDASPGARSFVSNTDRSRKILDNATVVHTQPAVGRSFSVRAASAPKSTPDRKTSDSSQDSKELSRNSNDSRRSSNASLNNRNNNYVNLSRSNLSLSSIVSSDVDIKRSNSVFDELMTSFEDENGSFPSLKSLLKDDSLSVSSSVHGRRRSDQTSDEDLSSPESYKRQDHSKLSGDSAYSSLNRKYSHHGRSTNDVAGRLDEDLPRHNRRDGDGVTSTPKCKMSKFCHECGSKFPETAKFCCECGIRRLVL
ncbi:uncharacterized protein LOC128890603 [Hylaeus anthracinus]|uniref:uncharacterized protein LOC128890603 n=1 Tax=Hylaeus anthracinus TaxID=313031 RepID=UPI0023B9E48F|nr:uncharacterized protein LOC128890603 [Hylaeus anthracinus]